MTRLLVISNGHGEDSIGAAIVRRLPRSIDVNAYPTLGAGAAYDGVCPIVGPRAYLASAGSRVAAGTLRRDLRAGLLSDAPAVIRFALQARKHYDRALVVGDMVGVVSCFLFGVRGVTYVDVYKSGYGRGYSGMERAIIRRTCGTVFVRHLALAATLTGAGVDARAAGNVMMDTIPRAGLDLARRRSRPLAVGLLPGSREETATNFALQVEALRRQPAELMPDVFVALAPGVELAALAAAAGLHVDGDTLSGDVTIHVVRGGLGDVLDASDVVMSQAGTATVQAVGLGKPVVSFVRSTDRASRQRDESRLFGDARMLVQDDATELSGALTMLLRDEAYRLRRGAIGRDRIGPPGALDAIVAELSR